MEMLAKIRQLCPCHGGSRRGGALRFHRSTETEKGAKMRRRLSAKGGWSGSERSKLETREYEDGGEGGAGYNSCDRGQLGQIWESWNLSLRKDDPTLSRSLYHWPPLGTERGTSGMEISQFFKSGIVEM